MSAPCPCGTPSVDWEDVLRTLPPAKDAGLSTSYLRETWRGFERVCSPSADDTFKICSAQPPLHLLPPTPPPMQCTSPEFVAFPSISIPATPTSPVTTPVTTQATKLVETHKIKPGRTRTKRGGSRKRRGDRKTKARNKRRKSTWTDKQKRDFRLVAERRREARRQVSPYPTPQEVKEHRRALLSSDDAILLVNVASGGKVGTDPYALRRYLNVVNAVDIDVNPELLEWDGSAAVRWQKHRREQIFQQIRDWDFAQGAFKLAASLRKGFFTTGMYHTDVGTFQFTKAEDPHSDFNRILQVLRDRFPRLKIVVLASPPCRMTCFCNTTTDKREKAEFLRHILLVLRGLRFSLEFRKCDAVLVEESVYGENTTAMLDALNCVEHAGEERLFGAVRLDAAADFGGPGTRKRTLFAPKSVLACLPRKKGHAPASATTVGRVLGVPSGSMLRWVGNSWLAHEFAGRLPDEPAPTLTQQRMYVYAERPDVEYPVKIPLSAVERALTLGCRPNDPRLRRLANLPITLSRKLTGITFAVAFHLGVLAATAGALRCVDGAVGAREIFERAQRERHALHPVPKRRWRAAWHNFLVRVHEGLGSKEEFERRLEALLPDGV